MNEKTFQMKMQAKQLEREARRLQKSANAERKKAKQELKRGNRAAAQLYAKNELDVYIANQSLQSWLGHSSHCDSHLLQEKIFSSCHFLYNSQTPMHVEKQLIEDSLNFPLDPTDFFFNPLERK